MELAGALPLPSCKPATSAATQVVTADLSLPVVFQGKQVGALLSWVPLEPPKLWLQLQASLHSWGPGKAPLPPLPGFSLLLAVNTHSDLGTKLG